MSNPNIPNINPIMDLNPDQILSLILASIGLEEIALAHMINAEAEKIQKALGTLQMPGTAGDTASDYFPPLATTLEGLLAVNRSVQKTMKFIIHKEFLLLTKLEDVLDFEDGNGGNGGNGGECCVNTRGFWRRPQNISGDWLPILLGNLGGTFTTTVTTPQQAAAIAATPGGGINQLKAQLIATKLNIARCGVPTGELPSDVVDAINAADIFLANNDSVSQPQREMVEDIKDTLDAFNNGAFDGFPHC
ncbi:hypothetical protein [Lysinibacillus endophyticus]|uniref:hypothetical protein n=1 Tax=Ureibacillus endophyticus TaxID=1978490 RepID=UPI0020A15C7E|nr:hypothetical protein [Lysinibacillus endophyticus]MCP1146805.1 hypothetical protein [Lysinibacillus endophyticus]